MVRRPVLPGGNSFRGGPYRLQPGAVAMPQGLGHDAQRQRGQERQTRCRNALDDVRWNARLPNRRPAAPRRPRRR